MVDSNANDKNPHTVFDRQLHAFQRINGAGGIVAISQQDQNSVFR